MARRSESVKLQQITVRGEQKIVIVELESVSVKQQLNVLLKIVSQTFSPDLLALQVPASAVGAFVHCSVFW